MDKAIGCIFTVFIVIYSLIYVIKTLISLLFNL
jgi:hypothetical protein